MISILLWMGCSVKSTVELRNTKKAYETAQMSIYGDLYEDVTRNERVPNSVKKYINREVLYELSYANAQMQKSWEEYAAAQYNSSLLYTEKAQVHIDRALELYNASKEEQSQEELPQEEQPQEELPQEEQSQQEKSQQELPQEEQPQQE